MGLDFHAYNLIPKLYRAGLSGPGRRAMRLAVASAGTDAGRLGRLVRMVEQLPAMAMDAGLTRDLAAVTGPARAAALVLCAVAARGRGDHLDWARHAEAALAADPRNPHAALQAAASRVAGGDVAGGAAVLRGAGLDPPLGPSNEVLRGRTLWTCGDRDGAALVFRRLAKARPADVPLRLKLFGLALEGGRPDEASALLDDILSATGGEMDCLVQVEAMAAASGALDPALNARWTRTAADLRAALPAPGTSAALAAARAELERLRAAYRPLLAARPPRVAILCPIHRPSDLDNLLAQLRRQTYPDAVACLIVNNTRGIDAEAVRARWDGPMPLEVRDIGASPNVGYALNRGVQETPADFYVRFDADCLYFGNHVADLAGIALATGSQMVGKASFMRLWAGWDLLQVEAPGNSFRPYGDADWVGGAATGFARAVWEKAPYHEDFRLGEDTAFARAAHRNGFRLLLVDPFNHVTIRSADPADHTFGISNLHMASARKSCGSLGRAADIPRFVEV